MEDKRYEEAGKNYRFYLRWRYIAFAGGVLIFFGALFLTFLFYIQTPIIGWLVPALGWPTLILLWLLQAQAGDLYRAAIIAGKTLEGKRGGFFTQLSKTATRQRTSRFRRAVQSSALEIFLLGSSASLMLLAIFLYLWTRGWAFPGI